MPFIEEISSEAKTMILTILSILSAINLNSTDKAFVSKIILYIGRVLDVEAAIEERETTEKSK